MKERRYDIDWLRVLATVTIFLFHCARFFDTFDWHLKNPERTFAATVFVALLSLWEMPLFFLLSGFGSWYALRSKSAGRYLWERVKRLLVPLYTVGIFLILPPQFYMDQVTHGRYLQSIWDVVPPYWDTWGSFRFRIEYPYLTNLWPGHLWFLQFLFNVSLLTLPLLLYLQTKSGQGFINRLAGWCNRRGGIFLFLIPLVLVRIGFRSFFSGEHTWADVFEYAILFLIGYLIAAGNRFTESLEKNTSMALILAIIGSIATLFMFTQLGYNPFLEIFSWRFVAFQVVWTIASWSWIAFILGLGAKYLYFNNKVLAYSNQAVLPFYILHQTIILLVGWYIIPLNWPAILKYIIICVYSFALIMALYDLLIKRINVLRFLFGMRLKKRPQKLPVSRSEETPA